MENKVDIQENKGVFIVKICGNASLEIASTLRDLATRVDKTENISKLAFNMKECLWMDSTFMGMLAILAMSALGKGVKPDVYYASEDVVNMLNGLGLGKILNYTSEELQPLENDSDMKISSVKEKTSIFENADNVMTAHKKLMEIDEQNIQRFDSMVKMVEQDIANRKKESGD